MKNEFDWQDSESVVIPKTQAIAVYENTNGDIVIRQGGHPEDDSIIVIRPAHAKSIAESILNVLADIEAGEDKA